MFNWQFEHLQKQCEESLAHLMQLIVRVLQFQTSEGQLCVCSDV